MKTDSLLLTTELLKEYTDIAKNVEDKVLLPAIYNAQHIDLQEILGSDYLSHLVTAVGSGTTTSIEDTLLNNYIFDVMINYSHYYAILSIAYRSENIGLVSKNSEVSTTADYEIVKIKRDATLNIAQFHAERLINYLCDNASLFPQYTNSNNTDIIPTTSKYSSPIYFPNSYRRCNYDR